MPMTEEHTFDPNAMEPQLGDMEDDLGEHESYVDKLEAEMSASESEPEVKPEDVEPAPEEVEAEAEPEVEEPEVEVEAEVQDEIQPEDQLANPEENPMIPRERLNQLQRKRQEEADRANRLEQELAALKAQMDAATDEAGVDSIDPAILRDAAEKALDGDTEAFSNVLAEQFNKMQSMMTDNQQKIMEAAKADALNEIRMEQLQQERQQAADEWIAKYPQLDHESDNVNTEALEEAIMLSGMYEQKGYKPSVAMAKAVKSVAASYELEGTNVTPMPAKQEAKAPAPKPAERNLNQPPVSGQHGADSAAKPKVDTANLSQEEWEALPESVREAAMNGG